MFFSDADTWPALLLLLLSLLLSLPTQPAAAN